MDREETMERKKPKKGKKVVLYSIGAFFAILLLFLPIIGLLTLNGIIGALASNRSPAQIEWIREEFGLSMKEEGKVVDYFYGKDVGKEDFSYMWKIGNYFVLEYRELEIPEYCLPIDGDGYGFLTSGVPSLCKRVDLSLLPSSQEGLYACCLKGKIGSREKEETEETALRSFCCFDKKRNRLHFYWDFAKNAPEYILGLNHIDLR